MIRIVKMTFEENKVDEFISYFNTINQVVNQFPGCRGMRLHRDLNPSNIIFTYSDWKAESDLENYRDSQAFKTIWSTIKPWFAEKAEAWSVSTHFDGFLEK